MKILYGELFIFVTDILEAAKSQISKIFCTFQSIINNFVWDGGNIKSTKYRGPNYRRTVTMYYIDKNELNM